MLRFTKRVDLGILLLTSLSQDEQVQKSAAEMATRFRLSKHMVANILKDLTRGGLVRSGRGVKGGYFLAKSPAEIRLTEVVDAIEGQFALLDCCSDTVGTCTTTTTLCTAKPIMRRLNIQVRELFDRITVADFTYHPGLELQPGNAV